MQPAKEFPGRGREQDFPDSLLVFLAARQRFRLTEFDRVVGLPLHSPLAVVEAFAALAAGAELHMVPQDLLGRPRQLAGFVRTHQVTEWLTNHGSLSEVIRSSEIRDGDLPSLKHLLWSGRALSASVLDRLTQQLPLVQFVRIVESSTRMNFNDEHVAVSFEIPAVLRAGGGESAGDLRVASRDKESDHQRNAGGEVELAAVSRYFAASLRPAGDEVSSKTGWL